MKQRFFIGEQEWRNSYVPTADILLIRSDALTDEIHQDFVQYLYDCTERLEIVTKPPGEPLSSVVDGVVASLPWTPSEIVGFGGGSAIDQAKGVAVALSNQKPITDFEFDSSKIQSCVSVTAVPTLFGSGSEVTPYCVINNQLTRRKFTLYSPLILPRNAIVDPRFASGIDGAVARESAYDAFSHCLEASLKPDREFSLDPNAIEGLKTSFVHLQDLSSGVWSPNLARFTAELALLGGFSIAERRTGLIHTISVALAPHLPLSHGMLNRIITPYALRYNVDYFRGTFSNLMSQFTPFEFGSDREALKFFEEWLECSFPASSLGVSTSHVESGIVVSRILEDVGLQHENHRTLTSSSIEALVNQILRDIAFG